MSVLWFIVAAIIGTLCLALVGAFRWRWWWRGIVTIGVIIFVVLLERSFTPTTLGDSTNTVVGIFNTSPVREFVLFGIMLLGMMARMLSLAIEERRARLAQETHSEQTKAKLRIDRWEFVYPMLFAVPTFGALVGQLQSGELTFAAATLAFQNGFFWQTILKRNIDGN